MLKRDGSLERIRPWNRVSPALVLLMFCAVLNGCAAITNPVANGVPVRRLPPHFLARPRENDQPVPLSLLRQKPPEKYILEPGDVLGVWIEGVLGERNQTPPVGLTERGRLPPAIGYPIPIREDGTISLPLIDPIKVQGMTLIDAENAIREAYTVKRQILRPDRERIIVTLLRPRTYSVLVIREDSGGLLVNQAGLIGNTKRGTGSVVDLPAYENDVLNALAQTGGLPGLDAENEIFIQRGYFKPDGDPQRLRQEMTLWADAGRKPILDLPGIQTIRIPLRLPPGVEPPFTPDDIVLRTGDIVFIRARDTEVFYTGGLLPPGEHVLPRDYDLDVVEAVVRVGGPLVSGGIQGNNLTGSLLLSGLGFPSPSQLTVIRRLPNGQQLPIQVDLNRALNDPRERILVQPGDFLILQEKPTEALLRYLTFQFRFSLFGRFINAEDGQGSVNATLP
ncbi:MAG: polysaccharide biosynthesis/export family protein [Gemmatales bacterium]|nr:polysaccharide biosynthesis/export family protein [Gemmatales bacterium]MDW8386315.1 polysaccharide biosynthesis/export family protein [Gemmatales bacterium]